MTSHDLKHSNLFNNIIKILLNYITIMHVLTVLKQISSKY